MAEQRIQVSVSLKGSVGPSRATEAAGVVADHAEMTYENRKLLIPHSPIEIAAVYQHNHGPATDGLVIESAAGNGNKSCIGRRGAAAAG